MRALMLPTVASVATGAALVAVLSTGAALAMVGSGAEEQTVPARVAHEPGTRGGCASYAVTELRVSPSRDVPEYERLYDPPAAVVSRLRSSTCVRSGLGTATIAVPCGLLRDVLGRSGMHLPNSGDPVDGPCPPPQDGGSR